MNVVQNQGLGEFTVRECVVPWMESGIWGMKYVLIRARRHTGSAKVDTEDMVSWCGAQGQRRLLINLTPIHELYGDKVPFTPGCSVVKIACRSTCTRALSSNKAVMAFNIM